MGVRMVSDELWAAVETLLPPEPPKPKGGRPRVSNRAAFAGIVYVLRSGIPWRILPKAEFGCSGVTWAKPFPGDVLEVSERPAVWRRLWRLFLDRLGRADRIDWSRVSVDSASVAAEKRARRPDQIP